jgi:hypothetical protein
MFDADTQNVLGQLKSHLLLDPPEDTVAAEEAMKGNSKVGDTSLAMGGKDRDVIANRNWLVASAAISAAGQVVPVLV